MMTIEFSVFEIIIVDRSEQLFFCAPDFVCIAQRGQVNACEKRLVLCLKLRKIFVVAAD